MSTIACEIGQDEPPACLLLWQKNPDGLATSWDSVAWVSPKYSRGDVDRAGDTLITQTLRESASAEEGGALFDEYRSALEIINNWRSSHSYPLQAIKMTLLNRAKLFDSQAVIAQRLKRLSSISTKLRRNPNMKLSQMQDLGGCRAVLKTVSGLNNLVAKYESSQAKNPNDRSEFVKKFDYVECPKSDGYRSVHLVYKYRSKSEARSNYNGLRIEIQIRSRLQHAWATAVETVSTFTGQALKSNIGDDRWKRFFALMGTAMAFRERRPIVPQTPALKAELVDELKHLSVNLKVEDILQGWNTAVNLTGKTKDAHAFLLVLDVKERTISVKGFRQNELPEASEEYLQAEEQNKDKPQLQTVLVSVDSLEALRTAYPNYYLDTTAFIQAMRQAISK